MKKILYFISSIYLLTACAQNNDVKDIHNGNPGMLDDLLTLEKAEKILGEPAHFSDSSTVQEANLLQYLCGYQANAEDLVSHKTGNVYFLIEQYSDTSAAQKKYHDIKTANEDHEGVTTLNDLGDEAYFHTDSENFYFIMARKGVIVFNMKVNKITSLTSRDEFNNVARTITDSF